MSALTGTGALVRLALRRDRLRLPIWVVVIPGLVTATASAIVELYPTMGERLALGLAIGANPALRALTGPIFDPSSAGGLTAWRVTGVAAVLTSLLSVLFVTRHTRAEEETGRAELIGAGTVGRHALPAAAVLVAGAANLAVALLSALGLATRGLPVSGALAFGLSVAGTGWVFTGVAALTAQLTETARAANAIALAVLGLAFLLRAAGDAADGDTLSWLSPLGWAQRVRAFADERWTVFALFAVAAAALSAVAHLLAGRRDVGTGLLSSRRGPATAAPRLSGPTALAWRLHRGVLLGWVLAFAVVGAVFGALALSVGDIVDDNPQLAALMAGFGGAGAVVDAFLATVMSLLGMVAAGYAVQAALRPRAEEVAARAEPVLAAAVSRWRWPAGHLVWALGGATTVLAVAGLAAGLAHGIRVGDPAGQALRITGAALAQAPAVWVMAGVAVLLFGFVPRLTSLAWAVLGAFVLLGQLGRLLGIDERIQDLSPFAHLPRVPGGEATFGPLAWLVVVAAALVLAGLAGFRRRDLTGG
ncbi:ABC transporter permease [Streptosporangium sp. NPDC020072]|uniref:ABC transporter permease n=1 Tax=Streptosporangium sp. NPDC020072 TaxID=3154788 RepID=UPI003426A4E6